MTDGQTPRRAVAMLAKAPRAGCVKTRLVPALGPAGAAALAAAFVHDLAVRLTALAPCLDAAPFLYYAPADSADDVRPLAAGLVLELQGTGDLGARLRGVVEGLYDRGWSHVVLVGSDSPTLPDGHIAAAFQALRDGAEVAVAPAHDGGYVLLGVSGPHAALFSAIPWSTGAVYDATVRAAGRAGLSVRELPGWYDVDTTADLERLRHDLARGVGASAPRTAQLLGVRIAPPAQL